MGLPLLGSPSGTYIYSNAEGPSASGRFFESRTLAQHKAAGVSLGCDISNGKDGHPLYFMRAGRIYEMWRDDYGARIIRVDHGDNTNSGYAHMMAYATGMYVGKYVAKGQLLGYEGHSGLATGPHVHVHYQITSTKQHLEVWNYLEQNNAVPVPAPKRARLNGNGINVRESAGLIGSTTLAPIYAHSANGVVRRKSDDAVLGYWVKPSLQTTAFTLFKRGATHGLAPYPDQWAAVWCGNAYRAVARPLVTVS